MGRERRKFPRYQSLVQIKYKYLNGQESGACLSKDISRGGACLPLPSYLEPHRKLIIEIDLRDGKEKIIAESEIAWCRKNKMSWEAFYSAGVEFSKIEVGEAQRLVDFARIHIWEKNSFENALERGGVPLLVRGVFGASLRICPS